MMPKRLADRLLVVSRGDYVYVMDEKPELLADERVTIVPVPLVGRWIEFDDLRDVDLSVGEALVRDPRGASGFVPIQDALDVVSREKSRIFLSVCQYLGAKVLRVKESDSRSDNRTLSNVLKVGGRAAITGPGGKPDSVEQDRSLSATLASDVRRQLRMDIETNGRWEGGEPDIEAARTVVKGHERVLESEVSTLIDQRAVASNQINYYSVTIDFFSELHRHFSLIAEVAGNLKSTVAGHTLSLSAKLENTFEWNRQVTQSGTLAIEVWFADPPDGS